MHDAEGASERTLQNIFERASQRAGKQTFHKGRLGRYKYYTDSHSFALVQPTNAEAESDRRAFSRAVEHVFNKLASYDRKRLEQILSALPVTRPGQEEMVFISVSLAMAAFRLFPPGEWYGGPYRSFQFLTQEITGVQR